MNFFASLAHLGTAAAAAGQPTFNAFGKTFTIKNSGTGPVHFTPGSALVAIEEYLLDGGLTSITIGSTEVDIT